MQFTLFSRSSCPLCEAMEAELGPFIQAYPITVVRRYIDNDTGLEQRYGDKVPVLSLDGEIVCEYFLDAERLLAVIESRGGATGPAAKDGVDSPDRKH